MRTISSLPTPTPTDIEYPAAPWNMHGQLWMSLFRVKQGDHPGRQPGIYGVAMVAYEEPSPLTYGELLIARRYEKAVTITDIWVDSMASLAGGRELWAIPKDLATFEHSSSKVGTVCRTHWSVTIDGAPVVSAWFSDVSRFAPRIPFKGATYQHADDGSKVTARLRGSAKSFMCRSSWAFAPEGELGWLAGKRPIASARMRDFKMSFG